VAARTTPLQKSTEPARSAAARPIVTIVCGGRSAVVDLRRMKAIRFQSVIVVRLDELWFESRMGADMTRLAFDFVGEDGFRPTHSGLAPLSGDHLKRGYLHTRSRNLLWDDPSLDSAFSVHGVAMIVGHEVL